MFFSPSSSSGLHANRRDNSPFRVEKRSSTSPSTMVIKSIRSLFVISSHWWWTRSLTGNRPKK